MCAVVGIPNSASGTDEPGAPPVSRASHSVKALATGMKVGFGLSGSCRVCIRTPPSRLRLKVSSIEESSVCITSTTIER